MKNAKSVVYCHFLAHTCIVGFERTCSNPLLPLKFGTHVPNKIFVHLKKKNSPPVVQKISQMVVKPHCSSRVGPQKNFVSHFKC